MSPRPFLAAAGLAVAVLASAAQAAPGVATGSVNMRTGPGTNYAKITTIPAGAPVEVFGCSSWCQVAYGGAQGYASARYISTGGGYAPAPPVYQPAPPPVVYAPPRGYGYRAPMPPRAYWRYGRPWWDDRYHAWYDGRDWWDGRGWRGRPRSGIYFEFGG